jgi:hypothetical protein
LSEYLCILTGYVCHVCGEEITEEHGEPHTYHAEGCPARLPAAAHARGDHDCADLPNCGEDVHEVCCPTCTGQAW